MRFLCVFAFLLCLNFANASVEIVHVWTGWRDEASFKRIGEYLDGRERDGGEPALRTQPGERDGFYFLLRTKSSSEAANVTIRIEYILTENTKVHSADFSTSLPTGEQVLHLGLTGKDSPSNRIQPTAWRLRILSNDGKIIAEQKSFLWEPAKS